MIGSGMIQSALQMAAQKTADLAARLDKKQKDRPSYPATAQETKILSLISEAKRVRNYTLESFEPLWTKAILFVAGIQHVTYLQNLRVFEQRREQDWKPLPVFNHIQPRLQRIVDYFTRNRPEATVAAKSLKETDRRAARLAEIIRQHLWASTDDDELLDEAAVQMATTGNAFKKTYIDKTGRGSVKLPKVTISEEPVLDPAGQPIMNQETGQIVTSPRHVIERDESGMIVYEEIPEANVGSYVFGPLQATVPLSCTDLRRAPWFMETSVQPLETLRQLYPDKSEYIPYNAKLLTSDLYVHRLTSILTSGLHGAIRTIDPYMLEGYGIVHQYERAPDPEFPKGLLVVEMDGVPLLIDELPLENQFSYEHCGYFRVPGRFWYRGAVEDAMDPQEGINRLEQYLQLNDAYNVNPCWLIPKEAGLAEGSMGNQPGRVYRYNYPYEPKRLPGEPMPPQIVQRRAIYVDDLDRIMNTREVTMGGAPPGVTAGVALARLGEEAEGMFTPIERRYHRFIERDQTKKLMFAQRFYTVPRYLSVRQAGTLVEVFDFVGSQLMGNVNVTIEAESYRPRSKSGEQQLLFDAIDRGMLPTILTDPIVHGQVLDRMGIPGFELPQSLDAKRAKWENEILVRSQGWDDIHRNAGDDDMMHLRIHSEFRKTDDWLRYPLHIQQRLLMHEIEHLKAIMMANGFSNSGDIEPKPEDMDDGGGAGEEEGLPGEQNSGQNPKGGGYDGMQG